MRPIPTIEDPERYIDSAFAVQPSAGWYAGQTVIRI